MRLDNYICNGGDLTYIAISRNNYLKTVGWLELLVERKQAYDAGKTGKAVTIGMKNQRMKLYRCILN